MAQTSRVAGAVQGSVVYQTGSAVVGATVTLRNQGTNQTRRISTKPEGSFRADELPVGQYELRVESPGFSPYVNSAILVSIGRVVEVTVQLAPATVQEQITVSEQPPPIDPTQTTEATTIDHERIEESPVVSRNYLDFVLLAPQLSRSNIQGATGGKAPFLTAGSRSRAYVLAATASTSMVLRITMNSRALYARNCRLRPCRSFRWSITVSPQSLGEARAAP